MFIYLEYNFLSNDDTPAAGTPAVGYINMGIIRYDVVLLTGCMRDLVVSGSVTFVHFNKGHCNIVMEASTQSVRQHLRLRAALSQDAVSLYSCHDDSGPDCNRGGYKPCTMTARSFAWEHEDM